MITILQNGLIHDAVHETPFTGDVLIENEEELVFEEAELWEDSGDPVNPDEESIQEETIEEGARTNTKQDLTALAVLAAEGITKESDLWKQMDQAIMESSGYADRDEVMAAGISAGSICSA